MSELTIVYDEPQEAMWFRGLHPELELAREVPIAAVARHPLVEKVLAYDRPDIIVLLNDTPVLVVEETVEVPSGHNVGQRFARIAAAAECGVPSLYFGPYKAKKHGGQTAGPRYMNLRLFHALDVMVRATNTAITTINWPVDEHCEVRRDGEKDRDVKEYIETFLAIINQIGSTTVSARLLESVIHNRMIDERHKFISESVVRPTQYEEPPTSVEVLSVAEFEHKYNATSAPLPPIVRQVVVYKIGMKNIRSDPYTGMTMLYKYLYIVEHESRALILWFPNITKSAWHSVSKRNRKDIRLFRVAASAILFADGLLFREDL